MNFPENRLTFLFCTLNEQSGQMKMFLKSNTSY